MQTLCIDALECVSEQRGPNSLAAMGRVGTDEGQVPVRFLRMRRGELLQYGEDLGLGRFRYSLPENRFQYISIGSHTRRKPQRSPEEILADVRHSQRMTGSALNAITCTLTARAVSVLSTLRICGWSIDFLSDAGGTSRTGFEKSVGSS
jgi:hypothetical protein